MEQTDFSLQPLFSQGQTLCASAGWKSFCARKIQMPQAKEGARPFLKDSRDSPCFRQDYGKAFR